jgi:hypothetical protein
VRAKHVVGRWSLAKTSWWSQRAGFGDTFRVVGRRSSVVGRRSSAKS